MNREEPEPLAPMLSIPTSLNPEIIAEAYDKYGFVKNEEKHLEIEKMLIKILEDNNYATTILSRRDPW